MGAAALSDRHPLADDRLALPALLPAADAVLAVGTRLLGPGNQPLRAGGGAPLIRIDADPTQLSRTAPATVGIAADAKLALAALVERVGRHNRPRPSRRDDLAAIKRAADRAAEHRRSRSPRSGWPCARRSRTTPS